ncbi:MAG: MBL fold metallo-hydrolase [Ardenticatenales bacterium]|nr:MBL fold metallo-hydrolase [Ardenticatenales bacterium]
MPLRVTSYGAAGTVTGSAHLIEIDDARVLVDLGMFQGTPELESWNREPLGFDARSLDAVIITHGHLDHCGRLPLILQQGFRGPIYATTASRDVVRLILVDSARVQAEDFRRQRVRAGSDLPAPPPMYTEQDVYETLDQIQTVRMDEPFLIKGVRVCFGPAGHILGSAFIQFTGRDVSFIAGGDLGHWGPHVVPDPAMPPRTDVLMVETTYGGQFHPHMSQAVDQMVGLIHETTRAGGNLLIPTFALERTQDVLHQLRIAYDKKRLPQGTKVFLDSPLGIRFTQLYRRYPEQLSNSVKKYIKQGESPFSWGDVHYTISSQESREIQEHSHGAVIMAGSGMANAGRIINHLKENLQRPESAVAFVGFQAEGTLGRQLVDGAEVVLIDGQEFRVRAKIVEIDGFSAHADQAGIVRWVAAAGKPEVLLVHGEEEAPIAIQTDLRDNHGINGTISQRTETYSF